MRLTRVVRSRRRSITGQNEAILVVDGWNDFGFHTLFDLVLFDGSGTRLDIGQVKIMSRDMESSVEIPETFETLDDRYCSLGQDQNYYENIAEMSTALRTELLSALRDCVFDPEIFNSFKEHTVFRVSLTRSVSERSIPFFASILTGQAVLTPFRFEYTFPAIHEDQLPATISFGVVPNSMPPTNVHVIIGRNGAGKTHLLGNVSLLLCQTVEPGHNHELGRIQFPREEFDSEDRFANLVAVTFSAFDPFRAPIVGAQIQGNMRYSYVGLKKPSAPEDAEAVSEDDDTSDPENGAAVPETPDGGPDEVKTLAELAKEFEESLLACLTGPRRRRWVKAIETLESDNGFTDLGLRSLLGADLQSTAHEIAGVFGALSSGHKIVLLAVTRLVELVEERTLVLLDEPEAHLHPPLLSSFVRVLSDLLISRNGAAIVATHSPVALQEVPSDCVWVLRRSGGITQVSRPQIQTFGENVGVLTREIFGLEVRESGFHKLIAEKTIELDADYEAVLESFGGRLGAEGRAIALALARRRRG